MKKFASIAVCFFIVLSFPLLALGQIITVINDNILAKEGLEAGSGFSCLIQGPERTILFDTGGWGPTLLTNMEKLGIDPHDIDVVVLSHLHDDHVGGLKNFLEMNHNVTVYFPNSFPAGFKNMVMKYGAGVVEIHTLLKISDSVYSSGALGDWGQEQALLLHTDNGLMIIIGCAHPGIIAIVQKAKELLNDEVLLVMGGFHLRDERRDSLEQIVSELKQLGVRYVGPGHCSGDLTRQIFEEAYHSNFITVGVGKVITLEDLR